jgi:hypothetical protein
MSFWSRFFRRTSTSPRLPDFPYPLVAVPGAEAVATLETLRAHGAREGVTPILLGDEESLIDVREGMEECADDLEELLADAREIEVAAWLRERRAEDPQRFTLTPGAWPPAPTPALELMAPRNVLTGRFKAQVFLTLVPTPVSWEALAFLHFGGWDDCPYPEEHLALAREWHHRYGADLVAVTGDTLEFLVRRPPTTRATAEVLAREQFLYCPTLVHGGLDTLAGLAATLLNAPVWFFSWESSDL